MRNGRTPGRDGRAAPHEGGGRCTTVYVLIPTCPSRSCTCDCRSGLLAPCPLFSGPAKGNTNSINIPNSSCHLPGYHQPQLRVPSTGVLPPSKTTALVGGRRMVFCSTGGGGQPVKKQGKKSPGSLSLQEKRPSSPALRVVLTSGSPRYVLLKVPVVQVWLGTAMRADHPVTRKPLRSSGSASHHSSERFLCRLHIRWRGLARRQQRTRTRRGPLYLNHPGRAGILSRSSAHAFRPSHEKHTSDPVTCSSNFRHSAVG